MTPLPPSLEEAIRVAAERLHEAYIDSDGAAQFYVFALGTLRFLVLRAQRETRKQVVERVGRMGQVAENVVHQMRHGELPDDTLQETDMRAKAFHEAARVLKGEFGLDD